MKVGFIGAGNVTATIGVHLIKAGRTIVVANSRGPETLGKFVTELGPGAIAGTKQQAAECDFAVLGQALARAFARTNIDLTVASRRPSSRICSRRSSHRWLC